MSSDIEKAYKALKNKLTPYTTLFKYAEGNQPLMYTAERLEEAFRNLNARFNQNWCSVVINAALDRTTFTGWNVAKDKTADAEIDDLYKNNQVALEAYEVHRAAMITSEGYIIAWKEEDNVEIYYNDPRLCVMFYDGDNPKRKAFAAKWWRDNDDRWHMTLYYPDRLEYYITQQTFKGSKTPSSAAAFKPAEKPSMPNTYDTIPVFHFRVARNGKGDLTDIITLQDAVNKLLSDMMVAAEFGAFKQRWIISNSDTTALKNGAGMRSGLSQRTRAVMCAWANSTKRRSTTS